MLEFIKTQTRQAAEQFLEKAGLKRGQILVVGCSSSEVGSFQIGSHSSQEIGQAVFQTLQEVLAPNGIYLAAQCCEHLNRAIILEKEAAEWYRLPVVNAVPQPKAGGSFATAAYAAFRQPVAVEQIQAQAGMDIGGTLIGMHLAPVAVPVRLSLSRIGEAGLICARTRPKYIGGERTHYDSELG